MMTLLLNLASKKVGNYSKRHTFWHSKEIRKKRLSLCGVSDIILVTVI